MALFPRVRTCTSDEIEAAAFNTGARIEVDYARGEQRLTLNGLLLVAPLAPSPEAASAETAAVV